MFVAEVPAANGQNPPDLICPSPTATQSICRHPDLFASSQFTAAEGALCDREGTVATRVAHTAGRAELNSKDLAQ